MLIPILLFILGLICLVKGGDWFVDGATAIAHRFQMPELLIGATVVSIGTTIPEVMVSATGALQGSSAIAYGNAIGSVICNTSLIAAITLAFRPSGVSRKSIQMPVVFFFIAAVIYAATAYTTGYFSRPIGLILLAMFVVYIILSVREATGIEKEVILEEHTLAAFPEEDDNNEEMSVLKAVILLTLGAAVIAVGANLLVNNGTIIAKALGVPESVIALTFVALGTSLPELVTAVTALLKGHSDLSLGNVIGANLFNLVLVSGTAMTIRPFTVSEAVEKFICGMNSSFVVDIPVMFAVMLLLCIPAVTKEKLYRWQGILLLIIYFSYITFQFFI